MKDKTQRKDKTINTKVNMRTYELLQAITKKAGISPYNFLQIVTDCFVKCFCYSEPISEEMQELLDKFTDFDKSKNGFSFVAPYLQNLKMSKCLAIVEQAKKDIPEIVLLEKNKSTIKQNINSDQILTIFLQAFSPKVLRGLQAIKKTDKMHNLTDALNFAVKNSIVPAEDTMHTEILELFEDANKMVFSTIIEPTDQQEKRLKATPENIRAQDFSRGAMRKRGYKRNTDFEAPIKHKKLAQAFDPTELYDPLRDYEPEYI